MATAVLLVIDAMGISTWEYLLGKFHGEAHFPNLSRLGLGMVLGGQYGSYFDRSDPGSSAMVLSQASASADSVIGHREMVGIIDARTYNLFPDGFPVRYIAELERRIGRKTMFNRMGGGVEVIEENAVEHAATGHPIVYASKCDPLLQVAMDEEVIAVAEQHKIADIALALALETGIPITRAIARSYVRREGEYVRTANRHDAVLPLPSGARTLVDILNHHGIWTVSVGKPSNLVNTPFDEEFHLVDPCDLDPRYGLRFVHPRKKDTNPFTVQGVLKALDGARTERGTKGTFIFANLVDTDSLYGHTRDVQGAVDSLMEIDRILPLMEGALRPGDLLMVTADHGMEHRFDYGYHHKEPVPLLMESIGANDALPRIGLSEGLTGIGALVARKFDYEDEFRRSITRIPG
jgi:phosphopentomutase